MKKYFCTSGLALFALVLTSCVGGVGGSDSTATRDTGTSDSTVSNTPGSLPVGFGRVLEDNPYVLNGNRDFNEDGNFNTLLDQNKVQPISITGRLQGHCLADNNPNDSIDRSFANINNCYEVYRDESAAPLVNATNQWGYDANSSEFLQVHTFGHMKRQIDAYHNTLIWLEDLAFSSTSFETSIPIDIYTTSGPRHWRMNENGTTGILKAYSEYDVPDNAFYNPSEFKIGFGIDSLNSKVKVAQDPTVIYHETGHLLINTMMNMRNDYTQTPVVRSRLKARFYDEAGSLNEGIADWFSYFSNNRTTFGDWAFGRDINAARPLSEDNQIHKVASVGNFDGGRLSYPTYLNYDAHNPASRIEDIHYAGQIVTHYFVALTEELKSTCQYNISNSTKNTDMAQKVVLALIQETLAELGDVTATSSDINQVVYGGSQVEREFRRNLHPDHSIEWITTANPINYRSFFQTFARKMKHMLINDTTLRPATCPNGSTLTQDRIEKLLDDYGLLLFDTYNDNGNSALRSVQTAPGSTPLGHTGTNTSINPANRVKTELINKDAIILDPRSNASTGFVFDDRNDMKSVLSKLDGITGKLSSQIDGDLIYNNGNGQISPGEFVGVMPNIYNQSNSVVAGVQVLGNDWDHFKGGKPCNNLGDNFPFASEGAADLTTGEGSPGGCNYTTRENGDDANESLAPVCFVQVEDNGVLIWASQERLRNSIGLNSSQCLSENGKTDDCFIRTVDGYDHSWFSRIDPNSSWTDSLQDSEGQTKFQQNNLIFMEVNPNTPPGTRFNCRFRVRFTNCRDCWHDTDFNNDDFLDYEFSGGEPFQIMNFQFRVID